MRALAHRSKDPAQHTPTAASSDYSGKLGDMSLIRRLLVRPLTKQLCCMYLQHRPRPCRLLKSFSYSGHFALANSPGWVKNNIYTDIDTAYLDLALCCVECTKITSTANSFLSGSTAASRLSPFSSFSSSQHLLFQEYMARRRQYSSCHQVVR